MCLKRYFDLFVRTNVEKLTGDAESNNDGICFTLYVVMLNVESGPLNRNEKKLKSQGLSKM